MRIGLIDFDGKLPNLAIMKLSSFYKRQGYQVFLNNFGEVDKIYCSVLFEKNKTKAVGLKNIYNNIEFGGTGFDLKKKLTPVIESCRPDYDLYKVEDIYQRICRGIGTKKMKMKKAETIINSGIGFTSRGCIRSCKFCVVPESEGELKQDTPIKDIVNPKSNVLVLLDNNLTADPHVLGKLKEIKERNLLINITQGIDVRLINDEIAKALSEVKHQFSVHYAWDLMSFEKMVLEGIDILSRYIKRYRHLCYILVGFNTVFDEDLYRFRKLDEAGIDPYVMIYNSLKDTRLNHFARWVNSKIYKVTSFDEYIPWVKAKREYFSNGLFSGSVV